MSTHLANGVRLELLRQNGQQLCNIQASGQHARERELLEPLQSLRCGIHRAEHLRSAANQLHQRGGGRGLNLGHVGLTNVSNTDEILATPDHKRTWKVDKYIESGLNELLKRSQAAILCRIH